jgi:hypothetical protein
MLLDHGSARTDVGLVPAFLLHHDLLSSDLGPQTCIVTVLSIAIVSQPAVLPPQTSYLLVISVSLISLVKSLSQSGSPESSGKGASGAETLRQMRRKLECIGPDRRLALLGWG